MTRAANRAAGLAVAAFAAVLWLVVIPDQVDEASYGWMRPRTLPTICAGALGLFGLALAAFPGSSVELSPRRSARVLVLLVLSSAAVWGLSRWGFLMTAPALAAALLLFLRERRPGWWLAAAAGVPAAIWAIVEGLLGRGLP